MLNHWFFHCLLALHALRFDEQAALSLAYLSAVWQSNIRLYKINSVFYATIFSS
ncbi:hypothetical protein [Rickettsiella massiliensis]|uniref:hypothetical protein n=1 Tax=Rickettsiella massiliensis TaxID=676517 RepID=UPI0002E600FD|nr:hypothetical protein [Rickettsiella massiliensis]